MIGRVAGWAALWRRRVAMAATAAAALAVAPARADDGPTAARWIGPEAVVYLEVPRPADLYDALATGPLGAVVGDQPAYQKALDAPQARQARAAVDFVANLLGTTPDRGLRNLAGGGIVFAIEEAQPPRAILVVTPTDPEFLKTAHAKLIEMARKDAVEKGKPDPIKQADHRGVTGYSLSDQEAHAIVDGRLIVANGGDALKAVIDRTLDPSSKSIVDDELWQSRRKDLAADGAAAWAVAKLDRLRVLDPKRFGRGDAQPDAGATFLFGPWIAAIQTAPWAAAVLRHDGDRLAAEFVLPTPEKGFDEPLLAFIPPAGAGAPAPIRVPGGLATINLWRDAAAIWEKRAELFPPEAQAGFAQLDGFAGTFFAGRDFASVLDSLGTSWRLVAAAQDPSALDPRPDLALPAFALVIDLKPDDPELPQRLKVAFQSFIGVVNLGAAETKAPPLELGSETVGGVTIATSKFMRAPSAEGEPVHLRHNFSPSAMQVGDRFVFSSSIGLARDLVAALTAAPASGGLPANATLLAEADGRGLAGLVAVNRERLALQNMVEQGNDRASAEAEIDALAALLRALGQAELTVEDRPESVRARLGFTLGRP